MGLVRRTGRMSGRVAAALAMCASLGCARARLDSGTIVGAWVAVGVPHDLAASAGARIVFAPDGTFSATSVPGELVDALSRAPREPRSASGTWSMPAGPGPAPAVALESRRVDGAPTHNSSRLDASCGWRGCALWFYVGDPDDGIRLTFRKAPGAIP
jgi:hypothetical protein